MSRGAADDDLDLLAVVGPADDPRRRCRADPADAHAAVPPTVSSVTRRVGHAVADGDALAVLAARAGVAHGEVVADGVDLA